MAGADGFLAVINGIVSGLNSGLEKRHEREYKQKLLELKQAQLAINSQKTAGFNKYLENLIPQKETLAQDKKDIALQGQEITRQKNEGALSIEASKEIRLQEKDLSDLQQELSGYTKRLQQNLSDTDKQRYQDLYDQTKQKIDAKNTTIEQLRLKSSGGGKLQMKLQPPPLDPKSMYLNAIQNAPNGAAAKGILNHAIQSGLLTNQSIMKELTNAVIMKSKADAGGVATGAVLQDMGTPDEIDTSDLEKEE